MDFSIVSNGLSPNVRTNTVLVAPEGMAQQVGTAKRPPRSTGLSRIRQKNSTLARSAHNPTKCSNLRSSIRSRLHSMVSCLRWSASTEVLLINFFGCLWTMFGHLLIVGLN